MKQTPAELKIGDIFEVAHPFIRDTYTEFDFDGGYEVPCWRPGVRMEDVPPDDCDAVADGMGHQIITIVSIHKPGRFPTRVFYTRKWRDPNGKEFGKGSLRMFSSTPFLRLLSGYRHKYVMAGAKAAAKNG